MKFRDNYWFLSNFYPCKITFNGFTYLCAEAAYQAQKCPERAKEFTNLNGFQAKKLGKHVPMVKNFNAHKTFIMYQVLYYKFTQNSDLKDKLLNTHDLYLQEDNTWHDTYWGVCNGIGQNVLGRLLMCVREDL